MKPWWVSVLVIALVGDLALGQTTIMMPQVLETKQQAPSAVGPAPVAPARPAQVKPAPAGDATTAVRPQGGSGVATPNPAQLAQGQSGPKPSAPLLPPAKPRPQSGQVAQASPGGATPQGAVNLPPALQAGECKMQRLAYKGNGVATPPGRGSNLVWGASATYSGNPALLQGSFIQANNQAKGAGLITAMYLEGPCGATGGRDPDNEIGKCRNKFQTYNASHRSESAGVPDSTQTRWKPYTIAQLKASRQAKVDLCEIDNMDNSDGLISFMKTYKTLFDKGEIYCRLILKNIDVGVMRQIRDTFGKGDSADFISHLHIKEVGGNGCNSGRGDYSSTQNAIDAIFREIKGQGAKTVLSRDTCKYESANFSNEPFLACPGGRRAPQGNPAEVLVGQSDGSR